MPSVRIRWRAFTTRPGRRASTRPKQSHRACISRRPAPPRWSSWLALTDLCIRLGRVKVGGFLDVWIAGVEPTLRPRTSAGYRQLIRDHLQPALGTIALQKLRPEQVQKMYAAMLAGGSSPKTISNAAGVLHAALQQ